MKEVWMWVLGLAIALIAGSLFISQNFTPFKENQSVVTQSNQQTMTTLNAELNTGSTVKGSSIKALMTANVTTTSIAIKVDGITWSAGTWAGSAPTISDTEDYKQAVETSGGKTIYSFTKIV